MWDRVKPRPRNLYVQMDITTKCNLRCIMCAREQNMPKPRDMSLESFETIALQVFDKAAVLNLSCGAEPMASRHFEEILEVVSRYRIPRVELVTNGTLLSERRIHKLIDCGVTAIEVSVDGATRDTYERIRRGARFEQVIANLKMLKAVKAQRHSERPYLKLGFVMMRSNIKELPDFVKMAAELGALEVLPKHLVVFDKAGLEHESLYLDRELCDDIVVKAQKVARRVGVIFHAPPLFKGRSKAQILVQTLDRSVRLFRAYGWSWLWGLTGTYGRRIAIGGAACPRPWEYVLVNPGGLVFPCGVWYGELPMGDLRQEGFEQIWWGERYRRLREELLGRRPLRHTCANCPSVASRSTDERAFSTVK